MRRDAASAPEDMGGGAEPVGRDRPGSRPRADAAAKWLFRASLVAAAFAAGMCAAEREALPAKLAQRWTQDARRLLEARLAGTQGWEFATTPADSVARARVRTAAGAALEDPVLAAGGRWQFLDRCPKAGGCLAVEHRGRGEITRAYPFRPGDWARTEAGGEVGDALVVGHLGSFSNGDLLAALRRPGGVFPAAAGLARIDPGGRALWYRPGYGRGESHVGPGDTTWVPAPLPADASLRLRPPPLPTEVPCPSPPELDGIAVLDGEGRLAREVSVAEALLDSPWAAKLARSARATPCRPLRVNSVSLLGGDVAGLAKASTGDLVVSLGSPSAFAVLDRRTNKTLLFVEGTFAQQRSVKHLRGSQFVMFDKLGGWRRANGGRQGYSRALLVDAATGQERTVFPLDPASPYWGRHDHGRVSVSPDGLRVLVSLAGQAVEVRVGDGTVLAEFAALHDVRGVRGFGGGTGVARFFGGGGFLYAREGARGARSDRGAGRRDR